MALGRRCRDSSAKNGPVSELVGLGAVRATRGLGRKRVRITKEVKAGSCCNELESNISPLESLHQDLLIKVLCGVGHADLKQLLVVSKTVMKTSLVAKRLHFAYNTPTKVKAFRNTEYLDVEIEAPGAPMQSRICRRKISFKTKEDLAVSLFQSDNGYGAEKWFRRGLTLMKEDGC